MKVKTLCFMTGLTSAEWAAWVQAVGSVLAILAAIAVAWWSRHQEQKARMYDMRRAADVAFGMTFVLGDSLIAELEKVKTFYDLRNDRDPPTRGFVIEDLLNFARSIEMTSTTGPTAAAILKLRGICLEVLNEIRQPRHNDYPKFVASSDLVVQLIARTRSELDVIRDEVEKVGGLVPVEMVAARAAALAAARAAGRAR